MYPWPSLGGFLFQSSEHSIYGLDSGWSLSPSYSRQKPLGSATDVATTIAIGSRERSFELNLTVARFNALESLINTSVSFTDWNRPVPDSRNVFVAEVVPTISEQTSYIPGGIAQRKIRARVTLITT